MENSKGSSSIHSSVLNGKHVLLPPRVPCSSDSPSYVDFIGSKAIQKPKEESSYHQRTVSETPVIEDQPSWLDDLLDEPETLVHKAGHRRSSSDSFAYIDGANGSNLDHLAPDGYGSRNMSSLSFWASNKRNYQNDRRQSPLFGELKNHFLDSCSKNAGHHNVASSVLEATSFSAPVSSFPSPEPDVTTTSVSDRKSVVHFSKQTSERRDCPLLKPASSDSDTKLAKQQFAQRSRVRKLQYIAELERNVQAFQVEGSGFLAELEFFNQQNLILSMENNALKQRLESLTQEHLIKRLEHDVLEREIGRLRSLYQQQQRQPPGPGGHRRTGSRELECQFGSLTLKQNRSNHGRDSVHGPVHI